MNTTKRDNDLFAPAEQPVSAAAGEIRLSADAVACENPDAGTRVAGDIGVRLAAARQARGMSLKECGHALRLPAQVLARLEAGDFGEVDHHVFARGALNSYARLLGLSPAAVDTALRTVVPAEQPALVPTGSASRGRWLLQRYGAAATYIVLTATVAVPLVWLGLRGGPDNRLTEIAPLDNVPAASTGHTQPVPKAATADQDEAPLLASMTPFSAMNASTAGPSTPQNGNAAAPVPPTPAAQGHVLVLSASADCWIEVIDANGNKLDSGVLHGGEQRTYHSDTPLEVTVGNADGIEVTSDGRSLSLAPYRHANVARFQAFGSRAAGSGNG